ncbi:MAG: hypothetical protein MJ087_00245 [Lachnospiraceae bacterium]|nr:hypothetical protein [Lachnospiraceae bacterium]
MANIDMSILELNHTYTAKELAAMWGYKSHHALSKGVLHPKDSDILILFVTRDRLPGTTQFKNELRGNVIKIEGADKHGTDKLLLDNVESQKHRIFLFYREQQLTPFTFLGKVHLIHSWIYTDKASEFEFFIENFESIEDDMALIDYIVHYDENSSVSLNVMCQSAKHLTYHLRCERDISNREYVMNQKGTSCAVCGFNFAKSYGYDVGKDLIDIHYVGEHGDEQMLDFDADFIPVCFNCHRMLHRKRSHNISVADLKKRATYYMEEPDYEQLTLPLDLLF